MRRIVYGDNLAVLQGLSSASVPLIYIDPPFNTGRTQARARIRTERAIDGDRAGFRGERYRTTRLESGTYADSFEDYLGFLEPRLREAYRVLAPNGSFYFHIDYREVHYCKVLLDGIFGRDSFLNEIIWAYDYGARTTKRWPAKHDNILLYAKDPTNYVLIRRMSIASRTWHPASSGRRRRRAASYLPSVWWHTIVSPTGRGEDRLSDAETARGSAPDHHRVLATGRSCPRLLRGQRHDRRGGSIARARFPAGR